MALKSPNPWLAGLLTLVFLLAGLNGGPVQQVDAYIIATTKEARASWPGLSPLAATITALGGAAVTLTVAGLATLYLLFKRQWPSALILLVTVLGERALVDWLKEEVAKPRPLDGALFVGSQAYPSGHAANSMTAFLAVALLAVPQAHRAKAAIAAILLSLLVGLTRVLLGVHWPSDVVGGWALGLLTVALALAVARRSGALRLETKHEVVGRHGNAASQNETS